VQRLYGGLYDDLQAERWSSDARKRPRLLFQRGLQLAPDRADAHRHAGGRQEVRGSRNVLRRPLEALTRAAPRPATSSHFGVSPSIGSKVALAKAAARP